MVLYQRAYEPPSKGKQKNNLNSLTVVIATYNRANSLKRCLQALTEQTDGSFDVLILDGGSRDGTLKMIDAFRNQLAIRLIVDSTAHLSRIRDRLWREADGDIIASIDDDVVVDKNWIQSIKKAFHREKNLGGVTGPTVIPRDLLDKRDVFLFHSTSHPFLRMIGSLYFNLFMCGERDAIGKIYPSGAWSPGSNLSTARQLSRPIPVDYLEACNFAIPKTILIKIGGYDRGYTGTSEWCEVDVAFRIRKAGYRLLFDPNIAVEHRVSTHGVYVRRKFPWHRIQNFVRFYNKSYYPKTISGYMHFLLYLFFIAGYLFLIRSRKMNTL